MPVLDILRKKRDGGELDGAEIREFVRAAARGTWPDYQLSALLMAIVLRGMSPAETARFTREMVDSGKTFDLTDLPGTKVDKHSTGGVGDKVSLVLAPLAAACGVSVPMMSGRGLGHTGGTLDKLESIPGFRVKLSEAEFRTALKNVGCAMIGQTAEVAPADRVLYALRDVTATVESVPLITASILSKKIAEGISALVMDVKCGRGAFMKTIGEARTLAESIQSVGTTNGLRMETLITDMDVPLGCSVGNALEVREAIDVLHGSGPADLREICLVQAAAMVRLAGLTESESMANEIVRKALDGGMALDRFRRMVEQQGGDPKCVDDPNRLPTAPDRSTIVVERSGFVVDLDPYAIGVVAMKLGAGRGKVDDAVDHAVGVIVVKKPGERIERGEPIFEIHHRGERGLQDARTQLSASYSIGETPPVPRPLVLEHWR